ncbi:transposase IS4 family protein [Halorubrum californiense DSM 19288]|uniref:Transposase IS4 family protein n=1 Tax=Halorubrum californiense DSM 19288 TaxID=1227465 RepID=M0E9L8_9EURY|nr:transposase IS4 family protein [Halorubrum californiense DSM 19288]
MARVSSGVREHLRSGLARCHRCHVLRPRNGIETLPTPLGSPHTHAQNDGLVETDSCAILDVHCSAHWPHDTQTGRRVALRNTENIESFAGDKGYDDQSLRDALRSEDIQPLLRHRLFAAYDHAHNARLDSGLYGQRWMAEIAFSAIKRRFGTAVPPRAWYREFRELVLTATVYNLEQALKQ